MSRFIKRHNFEFAVILAILFLAWGHIFVYASGVDDDLNSAKEYYNKTDFESAIKILAGALKKDPLNQEALRMLNNAQKALDDKNKELKRQKIAQDSLNKEAQALYDKGELNQAIKLWSKVLEIDPANSDAAWMIQKTQTRLDIENKTALSKDSKERSYSKKIKDIADDISRLIEQAKDKLKEEEEKRKEEELGAIRAQVKQEEDARLEEKRRTQKKEESLILDTFKKGQELYSKGRYEEALREWELILPLLSQDSQLRSAIEFLKEAVKQKDDKPKEAVIVIEQSLPPAPLLQESEKRPVSQTQPNTQNLSKAPATNRFLKIILVILCVFLLLSLVNRASKNKKITRDFDPSKLREFIEEKRKNVKKKDKDIFRVS